MPCVSRHSPGCPAGSCPTLTTSDVRASIEHRHDAAVSSLSSATLCCTGAANLAVISLKGTRAAKIRQASCLATRVEQRRALVRVGMPCELLSSLSRFGAASQWTRRASPPIDMDRARGTSTHPRSGTRPHRWRPDVRCAGGHQPEGGGGTLERYL